MNNMNKTFWSINVPLEKITRPSLNTVFNNISLALVDPPSFFFATASRQVTPLS